MNLFYVGDAWWFLMKINVVRQFMAVYLEHLSEDFQNFGYFFNLSVLYRHKGDMYVGMVRLYCNWGVRKKSLNV